MGVTRLSLGVENFNDEILEAERPRAPVAGDLHAPTSCARALGFPQINIDLIAGMLGETDENWQRLRREDAGARSPTASPSIRWSCRSTRRSAATCCKGTGRFTRAGRQLGDEAALGAGGVRGARGAPATTSAAPTPPSRIPSRTRFVYRDRLWQGADMAGLGVASFGHVNGVHMQNLDTWETYSAAIRARRDPAQPRLPADRRGAADSRVRPAAQARVGQPGVLPRQVRRERPRALPRAARLARAPRAISTASADEIVALTRDGLLRVDVLLRRFFLPEHADIRYT